MCKLLRICASVLLLSLFSVTVSVRAQSSAARKAPVAMTNNDVTSLAAAGLPDDVIITKITTASLTSFDTSVTGLKALKAAGVSVAVIRVMLDPHMKPTDAASVSPASPAVIAQAPPQPDIYRSLDGKMRVYVTDKPMNEFNAISRGWSSSAHSQTGDDPRTVEIQSDIVKDCPAYVVVSNDPTKADVVLVFRRRGGERSSMFAMGGLSGLAISSAQKVDGASIFKRDGDMIFSSNENTVDKAIKVICGHIPPQN